MIIVKLQGGLGNQMFQYAYAKKIQKIKKDKIVLDISDYKYDNQRAFSLSNFILEKDLILDDTGKYNYLYDRRRNKLIAILSTLFPNLSFKFFELFGIYIWDSIVYREINLNLHNKNIYLHGYWQSEKYFPGLEDDLKKSFEVKYPLKEINIDIYKLIKNSNSICVHIRRGDFLLAKNKLANCSNNYYISAMKEISKHISNPKFFIFSDDIEDVKLNFQFEKFDVIYIENKNSDYEELRLMYNCKHFILSNSTFGWWASYLSAYKNKLIIAPQNWYTDNRDISGLIREEWILINN